MPNFYHGSITPDIARLEARSRLHQSEEKVVYLTDNRPYALFYIWDAVRNGSDGKHVTAWTRNGKTYYEEQFPEQLKVFYQGVSGYLYYLPDGKSIQTVADRENMYYSTADVAVEETEFIADVYDELLKHEAAGEVVILRYNDQTPQRQNELVELIARAILRDGFYTGNEQERAFMKKYFSMAWAKAEIMKT